MTEKTSNKKVIIGLAALAAVIVLFLVIYNVFGAKPVEGSKAITIQVVNKEKESTVYEVKTDAAYLSQAMEEAEGLTFEGTESEYGLTVETVNGEAARFEDGVYWSFYVNDEYCNYAADSQPVNDGDKFRIEYTVYSE